MNKLNDIFKDLEQLSLFDLNRLRSAISKTLDDPERNDAIKYHLKTGMKIQYYCSQDNKLVEAIVVDIRQTRISVVNIEDGVKWNIKLYSINLEGVDTNISPKKSSGGLDRNSLKVGDYVGWYSGKTGNDIYGTVEKLNPKTAHIRLSGGEKWIVYYPSLFIVTDGVCSISGSLLIEGEVVT